MWRAALEKGKPRHLDVGSRRRKFVSLDRAEVVNKIEVRRTIRPIATSSPCTPGPHKTAKHLQAPSQDVFNRLRISHRPWPYQHLRMSRRWLPGRRLCAQTTTEAQRVQFPSRKSEMLCWVNERSSNTADVPLPSGDWVLIPTQIDAG